MSERPQSGLGDVLGWVALILMAAFMLGWPLILAEMDSRNPGVSTHASPTTIKQAPSPGRP